MSIPAKIYEGVREQQKQDCFMRENKPEAKDDLNTSNALTSSGAIPQGMNGMGITCSSNNPLRGKLMDYIQDPIMSSRRST
ncbi:hypothetical protein GRJ2_000877900 [Grus japonensis]|uniref:Uncharacterized protein n=1 Tax=Grus japonensis TaxID=30415 RepID=A0ABC9WFU3_GRUJA